MAKRKIKWGIMGLGKVSSHFASDLLLSDASIVQAVASRSSDKAKAFAGKYGALKFYDSYEALTNDPEVDIVYIGTPHVFHYENTLMCLENGKSVLCEKPMGMNVAEVERLIRIAKEKNLFLMEGIWTRFIPSFKKVLEIISNGALGELKFIRADFGFKADSNPDKRLYNKDLGGGSLLDIGLYPIYLDLMLNGVPNNINAMARFSDTGIDTYCSMLFDHENGNKAILESTFESNTPIEAYIYGEKGSIKIHSPFHHSEKITITVEGKTLETLEYPITGRGYFHEIEAVNHCLLNDQLECRELNHKTSIDLIKTLDRVRKEIGLEYQ